MLGRPTPYGVTERCVCALGRTAVSLRESAAAAPRRGGQSLHVASPKAGQGTSPLGAVEQQDGDADASEQKPEEGAVRRWGERTHGGARSVLDGARDNGRCGLANASGSDERADEALDLVRDQVGTGQSLRQEIEMLRQGVGHPKEAAVLAWVSENSGTRTVCTGRPTIAASIMALVLMPTTPTLW